MSWRDNRFSPLYRDSQWLDQDGPLPALYWLWILTVPGIVLIVNGSWWSVALGVVLVAVGVGVSQTAHAVLLVRALRQRRRR